MDATTCARLRRPGPRRYVCVLTGSRISAAIVVVLALAPSADAATVRSGADGRVAKIAGYNVARHPTLGGAIRALGEPSTLRHVSGDDSACYVAWKRVGLTITFANFSLADSCARRGGLAQIMVIQGDHTKRWRTGRGLRVGMPL